MQSPRKRSDNWLGDRVLLFFYLKRWREREPGSAEEEEAIRLPSFIKYVMAWVVFRIKNQMIIE